MNGPLVSICVPTANRANFLKRSLESILTQDYAALEILIGDNASTDDTRALCCSAAAADPRVRYIRRERNIGIYPNHNDLIEQSQGEFIAFLHDDDEFRPSLIREEVSFLTAQPEAGFVSPDWTLIDEEGRTLGARDHAVPELQEGTAYIEQTMKTGRSCVGLSGTMIRRSALGNSRFNEKGPIGFGDFVLWFEIAERQRVGHIPKQLYSYRLHTKSLSRRSALSVTKDYREAILGYCDAHLKRWPEHSPLVQRWRGMTHKYLFWMLAYEISLYFNKGLKSGAEDRRYRTVFELMDYRLSDMEFKDLLAQFRAIRGGLPENLARQLINFLLLVRWTWPLSQLAPRAPSLRGLLRLQ